MSNLTHNQRRRSACNKYERTPKGFLMRKYRNMQSRVTGVQRSKYHLYRGKTLLDRQSFYNWAVKQESFWNLYYDWVESGYSRKLCPSVDRINSALGYEINNMEWVTHSENSRRGGMTRASH